MKWQRMFDKMILIYLDLLITTEMLLVDIVLFTDTLPVTGLSLD